MHLGSEPGVGRLDPRCGDGSAVAPPACTLRHVTAHQPRYSDCISKAADAFKISHAVIRVLIDVEGGEPGMEVRHPSGAVDLGVDSAKGSKVDGQPR